MDRNWEQMEAVECWQRESCALGRATHQARAGRATGNKSLLLCWGCC